MGSVASEVIRRVAVTGARHPARRIRLARRTRSSVLRRVLSRWTGRRPTTTRSTTCSPSRGSDDVEFTLLHVIVPVVYLAEPPQVAVLTEVELEAAAERYLEETARKIRPRGFAVTTRVVTPHAARARHSGVREGMGRRPHRDGIACAECRRAAAGRQHHDKVIRASHVPVLVHRQRVEADESASRSTTGARAASESHRRK